MVAKDKIEIIRFLSNEHVLIEMRSDGIVSVFFKDHFNMDVPAQEQLMENYQLICEGKNYPFMFHAGNFVTITKEARDNAVKIEKLSPALASAVIASSLAYKLVATFYLKFNKPKMPYKVFTDKEKAIEWLKQFRVE